MSLQWTCDVHFWGCAYMLRYLCLHTFLVFTCIESMYFCVQKFKPRNISEFPILASPTVRMESKTFYCHTYVYIGFNIHTCIHTHPHIHAQHLTIIWLVQIALWMEFLEFQCIKLDYDLVMQIPRISLRLYHPLFQTGLLQFLVWYNFLWFFLSF